MSKGRYSASSDALNTSSMPVSTDFTTGINSGLVVNPLQEQTSAGWSPLFINGMIYTPTGTETPKGGQVNYARYYFGKFVLPALNTLLWQKVNFKTEFHEDSFGKAVSWAAYALSVYYTTEAVLQYVADQSSQNRGMYGLRDLYTSEIMQFHARLKERIEQLYFPPNAHKILYNLHKLYTFSDQPGAPIVMHQHSNMFSPDGIDGKSAGAKLSTDLYQELIDKLLLYSQNFALLSKILPEWKLKVMEMPGKASINPQFTTHLVNSGTVYVPKDSTIAHARAYKNLEVENPTYQMFTNNLDGSIYALESRYIGDKKNTYPGFISSSAAVPNVIGYTNKLYYSTGKMAYMNKREQFEASGFTYGIGSDSKEIIYVTPGSQLAQQDVSQMLITPTELLGRWTWNLEDLM